MPNRRIAGAEPEQGAAPPAGDHGGLLSTRSSVGPPREVGGSAPDRGLPSRCDPRPPRRRLRPDTGVVRPVRYQRHGVHARAAGRHPATRLTALRCTGAAMCLLAVLAVVAPQRLRVTWREVPFLALFGVVGVAMTPVPLLRRDRPDAGRHRAGVRDDRAGLHRALRLAGAPRAGAQPAVGGAAALAVRARARRRRSGRAAAPGPGRRGGGARWRPSAWPPTT